MLRSRYAITGTPYAALASRAAAWRYGTLSVKARMLLVRMLTRTSVKARIPTEWLAGARQGPLREVTRRGGEVTQGGQTKSILAATALRGMGRLAAWRPHAVHHGDHTQSIMEATRSPSWRPHAVHHGGHTKGPSIIRGRPPGGARRAPPCCLTTRNGPSVQVSV